MTQLKTESESTRASLDLLYHVSRELTSALDLRTVLQRVLFLSMRNVGAISGSIIVLDDQGKPVESAIITGDLIHNHTTERLRVTLDRGLAGWVVRNQQAVLITDTSQDERWMPRLYEGETAVSPKSAASAPLLARENLVGVITLVHPTPGFFKSDHLALIQAIADQAGIAVLNARLYDESQRQARAMSALAESAAAITGSLELEDVLARILQQISHGLRVEAVALALIQPEDGHLVFQAENGWRSTQVIPAHLKPGQGIAGRVSQEGRGVIVPDVHQDPYFDPEINHRTGLKVSAVACAPIRYRGQVIGVLEALNPIDSIFDPDALLVLTGIGGLAGTAIRHAQLFERLQAAHQSYHELFDDSIDPILITDWDGKILEANRKAVRASDYDKEALLTLTIAQLHTIDQEQLGPDKQNLVKGSTLSYESRLRTRSRHEVPVQVYVRQVNLEGDTRLQWILRDITERKNLDTMREDLISMIYHDLRSPLANVVSSLDILETMLPPDSDSAMKSLVEIAMRSTERITRLTNSLLDINRLEAGQPIGNRQINNIYLLIAEAIDVISPVAESKGQTIEAAAPKDLPSLMVDAEMIRRVITNLLENAVKYSPSGSKIQVGASYQDGWVHTWVQDNGLGIPATEHDRIFDKFTRLTTREAPKGLGLGLAYCRLAIQGHGGKIWVESEPGSGSRFIFALPAVGSPG